MRVAYADSSALVKLFLVEPERETLIRYLAGFDRIVTLCIARVEVARALKRSGAGRAAEAAIRRGLDGLDLRDVGPDLLQVAATIEPARLRTLDALHLAAALELREALGAFVVYDARLAAAARGLGLPATAPGIDEIHEG